MISVFLGAGFSHVGGIPLASQLFDYEPRVDRITRFQLVKRVESDWQKWHAEKGGQPEEYLAYLQELGDNKWLDALRYVALVIALGMGRIEYVGTNIEITRHNINRTTQIDAHEKFWSAIFRQTYDLTVITTNYDILPERGLRHEPRPRINRPGFHYGNGVEELVGGGYPSFTHIRKITTSGSVPILKLHGSISWSYREEQLVHYIDCRPAIRGDAAIVAPVTAKMLPKYLGGIWRQAEEALSSSAMWIVVGYSLPEYDLLVRNLFSKNCSHKPVIHIFDPNPDICIQFRELLPLTTIYSHPGLPSGLEALESIISAAF